MTDRQFSTYMAAAHLLGGDYSTGYQRGLRRYHHGAGFGTLAEHLAWSSLGQDDDQRTEMGDGYRDGVAGKPPRGTHHNVGNRHGAKDNPADRNLNIRCLPGELAHWTKAAQMQHGRTRSDWIRDTLNRAATGEVGEWKPNER